MATTTDHKSNRQQSAPSATTQQTTPNTTAAPQQPQAAKKKAASTESNADKFRRLANRRVNKAIKVLAHVENLTNRANYDYTPEQAAKIVGVLTAAANRVIDGFNNTSAKTESFSV